MKNPIQFLNIRELLRGLFPNILSLKIVETNFKKPVDSSKATTILRLNTKKQKIKMIGRGRMAWIKEETS